jgi:hypothetical protein
VDLDLRNILQWQLFTRCKRRDCLAQKENFLMSARLSRHGLARLHDHLSDRDRDVIHSVATHRFLTGKQLARFHFDNHSSPATGERVGREVLRRLTRQGVLKRLERRVGGVRAGSASFVYTLGPIGRRLVGETVARRVSEPSSNFLGHTLAIAETHLALRDAAAGGAFELIRVEVEPACWRSYLTASGARERVRPDLYVISARGDLEYCWFLEIDLGTEHKPTLISKCRQYEAYWRSGSEQKRSGTFPLVVWVTPDGKRAREVEAALAAARSLKRELFKVVPSSQLVELFAGGTG